MERLRLPRPQQGISLIELMIALTLSSLLMLGVMRMFVDSSRSNASDSALAQVQDSARIAMEMIKRDVRMAGYRGSCVSADAEITSGSLVDFSSQSVIGVEGTGTNNDTLAILTAEELMRPDDFTNPSSPLTPVNATAFDNSGKITFSKDICYSSDDVFLISDCRQLAVFSPQESLYECKDDPSETTTANSMTAIGAGNNIISLKDYVVPPECSTDITTCPTLHNLGSTTGLIYDIRNSGRNGSDGLPLQALFRDGEEMVEGVENMQVLYGVRDGNNIRYTSGCTQVSFDNGTCNPGNTSHIRISLVVASSNNVTNTNEQRTFDILNLNNNTTLTTNDRRLRRVFTTTIQLRNQG